MNPTELAIIASLLGGIDETADVLGIDNILLQEAINGEELERGEIADITRAVSDYENDVGWDIDLKSALADLTLTEKFIHNEENILQYRNMIAERQVAFENNDAMLNTLANLNPTYIEAVINYIEEGGDIQPFLDLYDSDADFWEVEDSEFWEWFREVFYNE